MTLPKAWAVASLITFFCASAYPQPPDTASGVGAPPTNQDRETIIASNPQTLKGKWVVNRGNTNADFLNRVKALSTTLNAQGDTLIIVTGAYSDTQGKVVGFALDSGTVVNDRAERWDGFLSIEASGRFHLNTMSELNLPRGSKVAKPGPLLAHRSGFQSHLIVNNASNQISTQAPQQKAQRRSLMTGKDGSIAVVDSMDREMTLYDWADHLVRDKGATRAINLDMGGYDICLIQKGKTSEDCSHIGRDAKLSNALIVYTSN